MGHLMGERNLLNSNASILRCTMATETSHWSREESFLLIFSVNTVHESRYHNTPSPWALKRHLLGVLPQGCLTVVANLMLLFYYLMLVFPIMWGQNSPLFHFSFCNECELGVDGLIQLGLLPCCSVALIILLSVRETKPSVCYLPAYLRARWLGEHQWEYSSTHPGQDSTGTEQNAGSLAFSGLR